MIQIIMEIILIMKRKKNNENENKPKILTSNSESKEIIDKEKKDNINRLECH